MISLNPDLPAGPLGLALTLFLSSLVGLAKLLYDKSRSNPTIWRLLFALMVVALVISFLWLLAVALPAPILAPANSIVDTDATATAAWLEPVGTAVALTRTAQAQQSPFGN